jgi:pilus assembly protein CpaE
MMMGNSEPAKVAGKWKHLFVCPDRGMFQNLTNLLAELTPNSALVDLKAYPNRRSLTEVMSAQRPNICFLDVGSNRDTALGVIQDLGSVAPGLPVVAIHKSNDPDLILRCLRQGAREFLVQPFAQDQVTVALERLARLVLNSATEAKELGRVYCVMPAKGACGATTLACSLAFQLHRVNKGKKTLLADLDPTTGTLSFLLKLKTNFSFSEALAHSSHLDHSIWKAITTPCLGIDVVLSPDSPIEGIAESQSAASIIDYAKESYGVVVADSRGPYGEWGLSLARACDELIVVTTNELPVLHATQKMLAHLERNGIDSGKIRLVVNRYASDAGLGREAIETALHTDVFAILPEDGEAVQRSLMEGKPVASNTAFGKGIANIAERLTGKKDSQKRSGGVFSGVMSLFGGKA